MNGVGVGSDDPASRDGERRRRDADGEAGAWTTDEQIRVLHVDDDDAFVELAATFVTRTTDRLVVETETDATRALERNLPEDVDCVVSDYDMPSMNGLEFLQRVRERWPSMPFILYTGKGSEEIASEAISAGVTDYLQKEVGTDQYEVLANRIRNAVDQHRAERRLEARDRRFRVAAAESFDVIWDADFDAGTITWHGGLSEAFGFDPDECDETTPISWWDSRIHPDDRDDVLESLDDALESDGSWLAEYRFRDGSGEYAVVQTRGQRISDDGAATMIGALTDVTARREYERQLRSLHRTTTAMIDADDELTAVDRVIAAIDDVLGLPRVCYYGVDSNATAGSEGAIGIGEFSGSGSRPGPDSDLESVVDTETRDGTDPEPRFELQPLAWADELDQVTADGPDRPLTPDHHGFTAFDETRTIEERAFESADRLLAPADAENASELYLPVGDHGLLVIAATEPIESDAKRLAETLTNELRAVLDRVHRERCLEEHRRRLETLVSHLPGVAYRTKPSEPWIPEFVGGRVEALTGYPKAAFESGDVTFGDDLVHEDDLPELTAAIESAIETGSAFELTYRIRRRDGTEHRVWERGEPIFDDDRAVALEGFITDAFDLD